MLRILLFIVLLSVLMPQFQARAEEVYRRSLFVTVVQDPPVLGSRQAIVDMIAFAAKAHVNTLFVQVYRADQAWFPSRVGDQDAYAATLKSVGEDPFALLIRLAHQQGIKVHAWVNLLSLGKNTEAPLLKKYGPGILTCNVRPKKNLLDYRIDNQFFLEPGDLRVRAELLNMVGELLRAYADLDGIQFDYIRYPDKEPHYGYSRMNVERYLAATGQLVVDENSKMWKDWKRAQVTELLRGLVKRVRLLRPHIKVSTTGCAPYVRASEEAFQEWPVWVNSGLIDFVTVMTYSKESAAFLRSVVDARERVTDPAKLNIAVGAYEQLKTPDVFEEQMQLCLNEARGSCVIFHYGSLLESTDLKKLLLH